MRPWLVDEPGWKRWHDDEGGVDYLGLAFGPFWITFENRAPYYLLVEVRPDLYLRMGDTYATEDQAKAAALSLAREMLDDIAGQIP